MLFSHPFFASGKLGDMLKKPLFPILITVVALLFVIAAVAAGRRLWRGDGSLLRDVNVSESVITPNADGEQDITSIRYTLSRNADVSIYFESADGERHYFRRERPRGADEYEVFFSGVVEGYRLPAEEAYEGEILARLLQDGEYTWVVEATDGAGEMEQVEGQLTVAEADPVLPLITGFGLDKETFTPNRDGISDRVNIDFDLVKTVEDIDVFLELDDGTEVPIIERPLDVPPREGGRHVYDYAGGVDDGAAPPPDGTYPVIAVAEDLEGQRVRVEDELTIELGGVPYAKIVSPVTGDTLALNTTAVEICNTLFFTVTVENYGETPIRTTGPWSGTVYDSDWNYNTVDWSTESGVFRVGIGYENALSDYPYRWGLGTPDELTKIDDNYYLMPGQRVVVNGGIRVVDVFGVRNPQPVWAGLIHEDVEISQFNNRVDPHGILVDVPDEDHMPVCEERTAQ